MSASPPLPYWRLSSFYFWYYAALGGFTPFFARWLHDLGQPAAAISALMTLWWATRVFAPAVWSAFTARSPAPIRWLRAGAVLTLVGFTGFLFAESFPALFAVMLVSSFFCNAIMPQFEAITLDTLGARRADYGRLRVWGSIGFILVTLAYGWLLQQYGSSWLPALMLPLFAATAASAFFNRMPAGVDHSHDEAPGNAWQALRRPGVAPFLAVAMLMQIGFGPFYVFFTLYLGESGHGTATIGALWALGVLAEIALFISAPALLRKHGPIKLLLVCLGVTTLRWLMVAFMPHSIPLMALAQLLHALSFGIFHASCMQLVGHYFPGRLSTHGQALLYSIGSGFGGVLGAALAGAAWEIGGGRASFVLAAIVAAAGFVIALRLRLPELQPEVAASVSAEA